MKPKRWKMAAELRWMDHSEWFDSIKEAKEALKAFIGADLQWFGRYSGVFNGRRFRILPYRISSTNG